MNARVLCLLCSFLGATGAQAQGFAGLGSDAEGFAVPQPNPTFRFPEDHGPHPAYRIEWWYITANLQAEDGTDYGVQWTLFRSALAPHEAEGWASPQLWMGHAGLTTPDAHYHAERLARGGIGQAGATAEPFEAWIDDWSLTATGTSGDAYNALDMTASGTGFAYDLSLRAEGPLVFHGAEGFSVKSAEGQASYYYSQPFYEVSGTLDIGDRAVEVTGNAWLDREWSSQPLSENQSGWDWVSLHFRDGTKLMGFQLRQTDGSSYTSATLISEDGQTTAFADGALSMAPLRTTEVAGREVPTRWRVRLPEKGIEVEIEALYPEAWMETSFPYWEGPVRMSGTHPGRGYLEMTGYE
ncbi:MAG: lipocalin-like domain-containing protein [Pseudomonadota bacterium]